MAEALASPQKKEKKGKWAKSKKGKPIPEQ